MKSAKLLAAVFAAALSASAATPLPNWTTFAPGGERTFTFDFSKTDQKRIAYDLPYVADLSGVTNFSYEVKLDGFDDASSLAIFFKAGKGWYSWGGVMPEDEAIWERRVKTRKSLERLNDAVGWDKVDGFRIYVDRVKGRSGKVTVTIRNLVYCEQQTPANSWERDKPGSIERLKALPPKPGERRLLWCHSALGLSRTNTWEESVAHMKKGGFTDLIANLSWAGLAYYDSKYAPVSKVVAERGNTLADCLAACRRHGVKLHVWRVCYRLLGSEPAAVAFREKMNAEGRCVGVEDKGRKDWWLCPTDPRNQQLEIDAMCELAGMGVDGIHFDYIRHRDNHNCCCEHCRERFEALTGHKFEKWPDDVKKPEWATKWSKFREDSISAVVRGVAERVRKEHPGVEISAAVQQPWASMAQDWPLWCREGWVDFCCPMDYTSSRRVFARQIAEQREYVKGNRAKIYPGIGLTSSFGWPCDGDDARRLAEHIEAAREAGYDGFTLFNYVWRAARLMPFIQ